MPYRILKNGWSYQISESKEYIDLTWFDPEGKQSIHMWLQYSIKELQVTYYSEPEKSFVMEYQGSYIDGFHFLREMSRRLIAHC